MLTDSTTDKQIRAPIVLVVGGTPDMAAAVDEAAVGAQVLVSRCALADVTTVAAEIRPLVLREWESEQRKKTNTAFLAQLRSKYAVRVEGPFGEALKQAQHSRRPGARP